MHTRTLTHTLTHSLTPSTSRAVGTQKDLLKAVQSILSVIRKKEPEKVKKVEKNRSYYSWFLADMSIQ